MRVIRHPRLVAKFQNLFGRHIFRRQRLRFIGMLGKTRVRIWQFPSRLTGLPMQRASGIRHGRIKISLFRIHLNGQVQGRLHAREVILGKAENIIRDHINAMSADLFDHVADDRSSMQTTLDLAIEMNTEEANFYSAMAYPGSPLHGQARQAGWKLPDSYAGFSQHSYEAQPLPTKYVAAEEVLGFRDKAWMTYHTHPDFLRLLKEKFGQVAVDETVKSTQIKLKRKILEKAVAS